MTDDPDALYAFTIYRDPKDYPGRFVVRRFKVTRTGSEPVPDPQPFAVVRSLQEARRVIMPLQLIRLDRSPDDEPHIVETWI